MRCSRNAVVNAVKPAHAQADAAFSRCRVRLSHSASRFHLGKIWATRTYPPDPTHQPYPTYQPSPDKQRQFRTGNPAASRVESVDRSHNGGAMDLKNVSRRRFVSGLAAALGYV